LECQRSLGPDDWTPVAHADRAGGCRVWSRNRLRGNSWPRSVGAAVSRAGTVMSRAEEVTVRTDGTVVSRADGTARRAVQRPSSRAKNPGRAGSSWCPSQRWARGTSRMTRSTCWPQPAQVVLPQVRQVTALHMSNLLPGRGGRGGRGAGGARGAGRQRSSGRLGGGVVLVGGPARPGTIAADELDDV